MRTFAKSLFVLFILQSFASAHYFAEGVQITPSNSISVG